MFTVSTQHRRCRSITSVMRALRPDAASNDNMVFENIFSNNNGSNNDTTINILTNERSTSNNPNRPTVLGIMVTAFRVQWKEVEKRIQSHPNEARQYMTYSEEETSITGEERNVRQQQHQQQNQCTILEIVLSRKIDDYPPANVIKTLLDVYPEAIWEGIIPLKNQHNNQHQQHHHHRFMIKRKDTPLQLACQKRASIEILKLLTAARPAVLEDKFALLKLWESYEGVFGEHELINMICEGGRESFKIYSKLHLLLQYCTEHCQVMIPWPYGVIHAAIQQGKTCSLLLFQFILQTCRHQGQSSSLQRNDQGRIPLHSIILQPCWDGKEKETMIKELIQVFPDSLTANDGLTGLYPFQLAALPEVVNNRSSGHSLSIIYTLLRANPKVLLEESISSPNVVQKKKILEVSDAKAKAMTKPDKDPVFLFSSQQRNQLSDELVLLLQRFASSHECCEDLWSSFQQLLRCQEGKQPSSWFPIHAAISISDCPLGLLNVLISMHPEQLLQEDALGRMPLHLAVQNCTKTTIKSNSTIREDVNVKRVKILVESYPLATQHQDSYGRMPLHIASYQGLSISGLDALILAFPNALCQRDEQMNLYPFLLAACSPLTGLNEVYTLLLRAPHVLKACGVVH